MPSSASEFGSGTVFVGVALMVPKPVAGSKLAELMNTLFVVCASMP